MKIKLVTFWPTHRLSRAFLLLFFIGLSLWLTPISPSRVATAYIDPALTAASTDQLSVIVTAVDSNTAVSAVNQIEGSVTSELWLIDAAGATIPADQLHTLAQQTGIISIVSNQTVKVAGGPDCSDGPTEHGPCSSRDGWVTDRREKKEANVLPASPKIKSPVMLLPDGRFVAVSEKEMVIFADAAGNVQTILDDLDFEKMTNDPVMGQDGTLYFIGELINSEDKMIIYAISSTGEILWSYKQKNLVPGLALSPDNQFLYALEAGNKAKLYILDAQEGDLLEKAEPSTKNPGLFSTPPVVAPDGTVYLQSTGKESGKDDRRGNVIALNPEQSLNDRKAYLWRYEAEIGLDYLELSYLPVIADNFIYVFSDKDKMVLALDSGTGSLVHTYNFPKSLEAQPEIGANQTLYLPLDKEWHALNADLTQRFVQYIDDGKFGSPLFSLDGTAVYFRAKKTIYAFDIENGAPLWQVSLKGEIITDLVLDESGNIIAGSDSKDMVIVTPNGRVNTRLNLDDKFNQVITASLPDDQILILMGEKELLTIGFLPDQWDPDMVDVQEADNNEWEIINMVGIDIGADILHDTEMMLPDQDGDLELTSLSGAGVTIAVLDSGVYVDDHVKNLLHSDEYETDLKKQYVGQYDFVGNGNGPDCDTDKDYNSVEGYCFFKWDKSRDPYGHGSHVAGIIWSQITDASTSVSMGIAPGANVVSVRVLGEDGTGTYEDVVQGIQWAVENQNNPEFAFPIRVLNLSLSAAPTLPYFMDPINRAVESAWASGLVVLAAAGNEGPGAQNITVPGNDPYIITVGAINSKRTPGYWADDVLPEWSSNGPTLDGFVKPDVLAPGSQIISFLNNDGDEIAQLLQDHPDYSETMSLFRMNGTSMATAVTSGVVALMLEANPDLTPDQVKFRLMVSAIPALTDDGELQYSPLQQGAGRIWAPDAVLGTEFPEDGVANAGLDIESDLAHGWILRDENGEIQFDAEGYPLFDETELNFHYQGPVRGVVSDDGQVVVYYTENTVDDSINVLGAMQPNDMSWLDYETLTDAELTFNNAGENGTPWQHADTWSSGTFAWSGGTFAWSGGTFAWSGGTFAWSGGTFAWSGGTFAWSGGTFAWSGGTFAWSGGTFAWSGGTFAWSGGTFAWSGGTFAWSGSNDLAALSIGANKWIEDDRPEGFTVHVADLDGTGSWISSSAWEQVVTITVRDEHQSRVENATITGSWNQGEGSNVVCVTGIHGECQLRSGPLAENISSVTFTVANMTHDTLAYVPEDNLDLEVDSDGFSISGQRPTYRPSIHIGDLDGNSTWVSSSAWSADITIFALDDQGNPVVDATIDAHWKNGLAGDISCVTDATGQCLIQIPSISDDKDKIELEIDYIDHPMLHFSDEDNTDPDGDSDGEKIQVEPPAYRPSIHVGDLDGNSTWISSSAWSADLTIVALDDQGSPTANAMILAHWKNGLTGNISCVTDAAGQCVINVPEISDNETKIELEIDSIEHVLLVYADDDNSDPDGDSNGTVIQVEPPEYRPWMEISHVSDTAVLLPDSQWQAAITIAIIDDNGMPVSNALVEGIWKKGLSGSATCVTLFDGQCTIIGTLSVSQDKAEIQILSLTHQMLVDNSDSTTIRIDRPH